VLAGLLGAAVGGVARRHSRHGGRGPLRLRLGRDDGGLDRPCVGPRRPPHAPPGHHVTRG
jgi:hypothetical protein